MEALNISRCLRIYQPPKRRQPTEARKRGNPCFEIFYDCGRRANEREEPGTFRSILITTEQVMMSDALRAVILGIVEGITEFLPVSSTGHLLLAERVFDLNEGNFWKSFAILIQLGAILAIVVLYFAKLWRVALGMFSNPEDRRFVIGVLVAFLPAVVIGLIVGGYLKTLFN